MWNFPNSYRFLRTDDGCPSLQSDIPLVFAISQAEEPVI